MNAGDVAPEKNDLEPAFENDAAEVHPGSLEIVFWNAFTLATNGRVAESLPLFRKVFREDPNWIELLKRLLPSGLIEEEALSTILSGTGAK